MLFDRNKIINKSTEEIPNLKICLLSKENSGKKAFKKYFSIEEDENEVLDIVNIRTVFRNLNLKKKILGFIDLENDGEFFSPLRKEIFKIADLILIILEDNNNLLSEINKNISEFKKEEIFVQKCILVNCVN